MSDLIERQAAIDAICSVCGNDCDKTEFVYNAPQWEQIIICPEHYALSTLPSAQPEPSTDIQDALRYLDDVLHPLISPNNWNVYSELHDMVSSLMTKELNTDALIEWVREHFCDRRFSCLHCPVNKECIDFAYDPLCDEEYAEDFKQALIDKFSVEVIDD